MEHPVSSLFDALLTYFVTLESVMKNANATATVATHFVSILFAAFAIYKLLELVAASDSGGGYGDRVWSAWKSYRRLFVVYALIGGATPLCQGFTAISMGYVQTATATIYGFRPVAQSLDRFMDNALESIEPTSSSLAQAWGWSTLTHNPAQFMRAQAQYANIKGSNNPNSALIAQAKGFANKQKASYDALMAKKAKNGGTLTPGDQSKADSYTANAGKFLDLSKTALTRETQRQKDLKAAAEAKAKAEYSAMDSAMGALSFASPAIAAAKATMWVANQLKGDGVTWYEELKSNVQDGLLYIVACLLIGIPLIGFLICSFGFLKDTFAYMMYLLGFQVMARVAAAIATPLAGLFFFTLVSDKTESYGKNFINFWLSMVFSSIGLSAMAGVIAHGVAAINDIMIGIATIKLVQIGMTTTFNGIFGLCLASALALFAAGSMFGFAMNLIQRGSAIGNGIFNGSFQA